MLEKFYFKKITSGVINYLARAKRMIWIVGMHAFWVILVLVFLDIIFGAFLFYKYVYLAQQEKPFIPTASFQFKEDTYKKILEQWQTREAGLKEFVQKDYPSPF